VLALQAPAGARVRPVPRKWEMQVNQPQSRSAYGEIAFDLQLLTYAGLALYFVFWFGLRQFYRSFGITPEELGISVSWVLVRVGVVMLVPVTVVVVIWFLLVQLGPLTRPRQRTRAVVAASMVVLLCAGFLALILGSPSDLRADSQPDRLGFIRATRVRVESMDTFPPSAVQDLAGQCAWFLGSASGLIVMFVPNDGDGVVLRLPTESVLLTRGDGCGPNNER